MNLPIFRRIPVNLAIDVFVFLNKIDFDNFWVELSLVYDNHIPNLDVFSNCFMIINVFTYFNDRLYISVVFQF